MPPSTQASLPNPAPPSEAANSSQLSNWFATEVQSYQARLKHWLRARCPWLADVDDVAQDALLRLWQRQQKPDAPPIRSPRATLFAIAHNAAIDRQRHEAVIKTDSVADFEGFPVLDGGANVTETVAAREELQFLAAAIRELPERGRQVMTLTKIYGLTEREVGERLGLADSTVRTHIVRGMKHCADYLRRRGIRRKDQ